MVAGVVSTETALEQARKLALPSREEMLMRSPSVARFWNDNDMMLQQAWKEWAEEQHEENEEHLSLKELLDVDSLLHPEVRRAFAEAWKDPSKGEELVRSLWKEVAPDVFQCQFFDPTKLHRIRSFLDSAGSAGIPTRPPHGIVLNRNGFMLDPRSVGYLAVPQFQTVFYRALMDTYMRPLGRLLFPEYIQAQDDSETFGFTIQYQAGKDQSIRQHTDASALTLNININVPNDEDNELDNEEKQWTGSSLYFVDSSTGHKHFVEFSPGVAVVHRGHTQHAAMPITSGERSNMVLWLFGENGRVNTFPYSENEQMSREERWTKPQADENKPLDRWSPF